MTALALIVITTSLVIMSYPSNGQSLTGSPADPKLKFSTPLPPGIASPAKVETRLGTLNFFDGFPDKATAEKLYDNLDFQRAVQAYLLAIPAVGMWSNPKAGLIGLCELSSNCYFPNKVIFEFFIGEDHL